MWREAVRPLNYFARTAEDDDLDEERRRMFVASAAAEHAMGGHGEVNLPADANALVAQLPQLKAVTPKMVTPAAAPAEGGNAEDGNAGSGPS